MEDIVQGDKIKDLYPHGGGKYLCVVFGAEGDSDAWMMGRISVKTILGILRMYEFTPVKKRVHLHLEDPKKVEEDEILYDPNGETWSG